jgi:hypothetical protein
MTRDTLEQDIATVRRIARDTLGRGADGKRAARARRTAALGAIAAATSAGLAPIPDQEAEYAAAHAAWMAAMGWAR